MQGKPPEATPSISSPFAMTVQSLARPPVPPIHDYWKRPLSKDKGDDNADAVYLSVGKALSAWEQIDTMLAKMFGLFVESDSQAAERAYGAIASNSGRMEALRQATGIFASKQREKFHLPDFNLIIKHVCDASGRRNEIAHGIVTSIKIDNNECGFFLTPAPYNSRKTDAKTYDWWRQAAEKNPDNPFMVFGFDYRYTSADVDHFTNLFQELNKQVSGFYMEQFMDVVRAKFERAPSNQKLTLQLGAQSASEPPKSQ